MLFKNYLKIKGHEAWKKIGKNKQFFYRAPKLDKIVSECQYTVLDKTRK
jgi:hypothetical protein